MVRGAYLRALLKIPCFRYMADWGVRRVIFTIPPVSSQAYIAKRLLVNAIPNADKK
jgi:hypothetical protein